LLLALFRRTRVCLRNPLSIFGGVRGRRSDALVYKNGRLYIIKLASFLYMATTVSATNPDCWSYSTTAVGIFSRRGKIRTVDIRFSLSAETARFAGNPHIDEARAVILFSPTPYEIIVSFVDVDKIFQHERFSTQKNKPFHIIMGDVWRGNHLAGRKTLLRMLKEPTHTTKRLDRAAWREIKRVWRAS